MGQPNRELKRARENVGLTQDDVAKALGIGVKTYSGWECGDHIPYLRNRRELALIFNMSIEQVNALFGDDFPSSNGDTPDATIDLKDISEYREEQNEYLQSNLGSRLLSIVDARTSDDQRKEFEQIMERFDAINTENQDYQITRRQAVISLATFPFVPPINLKKRERVASSHYELFLQECGASLAACEDLGKSSDPDDLAIAFRCVCRYLVELQVISNTSPHYRIRALELAAHCAILKTMLGWGCAGNAATIHFAEDAVSLSREFGDVRLLLSAYSKRAWAYLEVDQRGLALDTARIARDLLKEQKERLPICIQGGTWSNLAVMEARNGLDPDTARKKALEQGPDNQILYGLEFTAERMWREQGDALYFAGKTQDAMDAYAHIIDLKTLRATKSFKGMEPENRRIGAIMGMSRASMKGAARNKENAIRYWEEAIEGAKRVKSKSLCRRALTIHDLMDAAFPDEKEIHNLLDHVRDMDKDLLQ
jgi:transcriptional regulator with XRE-family HTH domain